MSEVLLSQLNWMKLSKYVKLNYESDCEIRNFDIYLIHILNSILHYTA